MNDIQEKIAVLKIKNIQEAEKQKQYMSRNGKNLKGKKKKNNNSKNKNGGKNGEIALFGRRRSCLNGVSTFSFQVGKLRRTNRILLKTRIWNLSFQKIFQMT